MADAAELKFDRVTFSRGGTGLLGPVTLVLPNKGITVILGPNGAGKSLFLHLAHGLLVPDSGSVSWGGQSAQSSRASRAFVFQHPPVLRRSVADNVAFPLLAAGVRRSERAGRVQDALEMARLAGRAGQPAAALSGGERQRMALARALVTDPAVILLDEPGASLDPASAQELENLILRAAVSGKRVILATHDLGQAHRLADDVIFLVRGKVADHAAATAFFAGSRSDAAERFLNGQF